MHEKQQKSVVQTADNHDETDDADMPCDYRQYPDNWLSEIIPAILRRAGNCCEESPAYPNCQVPDHTPHPITGSKVVLTIAHMNHDITDNRPGNLRALCQLCHNTHEAAKRAGNRWRRRNRHQLPLFGKIKEQLSLF